MKDEPYGNCDAAPEAPDRFPCFALYPASPAMTKLCQPRPKRPGLTSAVLGAADAVAKEWPDGLRGRRASGWTQLLRRREKSGVIGRQRDTQHDEWRELFFLTEQGRRLEITAAGVQVDMVSVMDTTCDELSELTERVAALRERLVRARA